MRIAYSWFCVLLIMAGVVGCSTRQVLTTLGLGAAATAGGAAVYYAKGDLEADVTEDIRRVYRASLSTMEKRKYSVTDSNVSDASGTIEADIPAKGSQSDQSVTIKLERKEQNITHISVRVGFFGDEPLSRAILDDIRAGLR